MAETSAIRQNNGNNSGLSPPNNSVLLDDGEKVSKNVWAEVLKEIGPKLSNESALTYHHRASAFHRDKIAKAKAFKLSNLTTRIEKVGAYLASLPGKAYTGMRTAASTAVGAAGLAAGAVGRAADAVGRAAEAQYGEAKQFIKRKYNAWSNARGNSKQKAVLKRFLGQHGPIRSVVKTKNSTFGRTRVVGYSPIFMEPNELKQIKNKLIEEYNASDVMQAREMKRILMNGSPSLALNNKFDDLQIPLSTRARDMYESLWDGVTKERYKPDDYIMSNNGQIKTLKRQAVDKRTADLLSRTVYNNVDPSKKLGMMRTRNVTNYQIEQAQENIIDYFKQNKGKLNINAAKQRIAEFNKNKSNHNAKEQQKRDKALLRIFNKENKKGHLTKAQLNANVRLLTPDYITRALNEPRRWMANDKKGGKYWMRRLKGENIGPGGKGSWKKWRAKKFENMKKIGTRVAEMVGLKKKEPKIVEPIDYTNIRANTRSLNLNTSAAVKNARTKAGAQNNNRAGVENRGLGHMTRQNGNVPLLRYN